MQVSGAAGRGRGTQAAPNRAGSSWETRPRAPRSTRGPTTPSAVEPALYRTFADTEPTREGISKFADRYGMLGVGGRSDREPGPGDEKATPGATDRRVGGEYGSRHIAAMRDLVHLWDLCERGDVTGYPSHPLEAPPGMRSATAVNR